MAREAIRRGAASPSTLSSPTPSAVAAFAVRKDTSSPFAQSAAFRDVASPLSASHASLSTDPVHATLSPRPMSPIAYRVDHAAPVLSSSSHNPNVGDSAASPKMTNENGPRQISSTVTSAPTPSSAYPAATRSSTALSADKAAERAFYRRILFQDLSTSTEAPAITHDADLDHEIYLLLAYLLRETVLPWYSKLTPDREFLTQITSIITSIIHTVVQRQTADVSSTLSPSTTFESDIHASRDNSGAKLPRIHDLLSRDIPLILRQHCSDFRQAQQKAGSVWAPLGAHQPSPLSASILSQVDHDEQRRQRVHGRLPSHLQEKLGSASTMHTSSASPLQLAQTFHAASPHPGIDPTTGSLDGKFDMAYLRIAILSLLSSLLPADEYAPDTEKFIVRDVLVTVLRGALARSFRPWFFVQSMHKSLDAAGWPGNPVFPSAQSNGIVDSAKSPSDPPSASGDALRVVVLLLARLPTMALQAWTFIVFTALPFLVRAYFDLFNVQRAATKKRRRQQQEQQQKGEEATKHERPLSLKGTLPSSLSTGSLYERKMHGRFPSRKFQFNHDDTLTAQGRSTAIDNNLMLTHADLVRELNGTGGDDPKAGGRDTSFDEDLPPSYVGHWLDAAEELLQVNSHMLLRAVFGVVRVILGTTGLDESINRMAMRRINSELRDTKKLAKMVRELRRILLPNGHLPPSVPDPDVETQEAEWIRLRTRLVCASGSGDSGKEAFMSWLVKRMLLGSDDSSLQRGDRAASVQSSQIQLQRVTTWLEPFCSPQAAGPNTLLAILLFERVVVALCPDLTLS